MFYSREGAYLFDSSPLFLWNTCTCAPQGGLQSYIYIEMYQMCMPPLLRKTLCTAPNMKPRMSPRKRKVPQRNISLLGYVSNRQRGGSKLRIAEAILNLLPSRCGRQPPRAPTVGSDFFDLRTVSCSLSFICLANEFSESGVIL